MRLKYRYTERKVKAKLSEESYEVLGYGEIDGKIQPIIIVNDELEFYSMADEAIEIIDKSKNGYELVKELGYGSEFYLKKDLIQYCQEFEAYTDLQTNHIWNKSKLINYFLNSGYKIPAKVQKTTLNTEYKINLIQGYIMAVNNYISIRNKYGFWEILFFRQFDSQVGHLEEEDQSSIEITELETNDYKNILIKHLSQTIYLNTIGEKESIDMFTELFKLIDSIFINNIDSIHKIESNREKEISIKYESKYYSISKLCGS